jgi:iron complex outermembrane receptor protein
LLSGITVVFAVAAQPALSQTMPRQPPAEPESDQEAAASAPAKGGLEEIIVTARRRSENIQNVPVAITAITSEELKDKQVVTQNDLRYVAPSLGMQGRFGSQGGTYSIRGLGNANGQPTVGTYFAEVPSPLGVNGYDVSAGTSLYDVESVQVLKGPQGTLFGRTTTAGAVLVTPRKPNLDRVDGNVSMTVGTLGRINGDIAVGGPIVDGVLGVRFAYNRTHRDGYTKVINSNARFDEQDSRAYRISLEFQPTEWLSNSTIYENYSADTRGGAMILTGFNPDTPRLNLPPDTTAFNSVCATAVAAGLSPSLASCVSQRLDILADIKDQFLAEADRTSQGGDALRYTNLEGTEPIGDVTKRATLVNTTVVTLPSFGRFEWQAKNIFGFQRLKGYTLYAPVSTRSAAYVVGLAAPGAGSFQQIGNRIVPQLGKGLDFYTNETQLSGSFDRDRLVWVAGYYYQNAPTAKDLTGVGGTTRLLGGVTTYNLGYSASRPFSLGGGAKQKAYYAQATLGLDGIIDGVHLTAGYRHSKDDITSITAAAVTDVATGTWMPSATQTTSTLHTQGNNYNFSIDYKLSRSLLIYAATRKGYVPGGLNSIVPGSETLANYKPQYDSETIKDYEIGAKFDGYVGDVPTRVNLAYYWDDYSGIQRNFIGILPSGSPFAFTANVAAAKLSGLEAEVLVRPTPALMVSLNYSLNRSRYTEWLGADPVGVAPAGTILDLSDNPFANAPRHKFSANINYDIYSSEAFGTITLGAQAYAQSREWYSVSSQRFLDVYGSQLYDAISQAPYATFNARIDWSDISGIQGLSAGLFVRNIGDKIYSSTGLVQLNQAGGTTKSFAEPRTFGLTAAYSF